MSPEPMPLVDAVRELIQWCHGIADPLGQIYDDRLSLVASAYGRTVQLDDRSGLPDLWDTLLDGLFDSDREAIETLGRVDVAHVLVRFHDTKQDRLFWACYLVDGAIVEWGRAAEGRSEGTAFLSEAIRHCKTDEAVWFCVEMWVNTADTEHVFQTFTDSDLQTKLERAVGPRSA